MTTPAAVSRDQVDALVAIREIDSFTDEQPDTA